MNSKAILRYDEVEFHFLGCGEDCVLPGTVIIRDGSMVVDVREGNEPYCIVAKLREHWFEGENTLPDRENDVLARWADVGGTFVGTWTEGGWDYLFSFRLYSPREIALGDD